MLKPYTETQKCNISNNIVKACGDISKLNKQGYNFLYLASGFIAHYDINGFKDYYSDGSLANDIARYARQNQWHNFTPQDRDYAYYMSKRDLYNIVLGKLAAQEFVKDHFSFIHIGGNA